MGWEASALAGGTQSGGTSGSKIGPGKAPLSVQHKLSLENKINQNHESLNQISGRAGRVNRIQRHDAARFLQIVCGWPLYAAGACGITHHQAA